MAWSHRDRHHARMRRRYTDKQRSQLIALVTGGQATVSEAAARLGVTPSIGYYWLKREEERGSAPAFARLVPSVAAEPAIAVRVGSAEIQVRQGFDGDLLRAVVAALVEAGQ